MVEILRKCRRWVFRRLNIVVCLTAGNIALHRQLIVLNRKQSRPTLKERDQIFWAILSRIWPGWRSAVVIAQPDTVVRSHKRAFKLY